MKQISVIMMSRFMDIVLFVLSLLQFLTGKRLSFCRHKNMCLFRWDYMEKAPDLEGFRRIRENGVMAKYMQPVFPTQTSPNHFSVATGSNSIRIEFTAL